MIEHFENTDEDANADVLVHDAAIMDIEDFERAGTIFIMFGTFITFFS